MNILLTGASGFLGMIIHESLGSENNVITLGRNDGNNIVHDLSASAPALPDKIDYIVHAAGKAHSRPRTKADIDEFYRVNTQGTINLCGALEKNATRPKGFIFISTVAVYGKETGEAFDEQTPLLAIDPYGKSKAEAEQYLEQWCNQNEVPLLILRLPLVIGQNAPGNFGSMVKAIIKGYYFRIGKGSTRRSMVVAGDVARCILSNKGKQGTYNLTDAYDPTFKEIEDILHKRYSKKVKILPVFLVNILAKIGDIFGKRAPFNSYKLTKITSTLTFSGERIMRELNWKPQQVLTYLDKDYVPENIN